MTARWMLGIDISSETFNFTLLDTLQDTVSSSILPNTQLGFSDLMLQLQDNQIQVEELHACMEATGVYYQQLAYFLFAAGVKVSVVNPVQIHAYGKTVLRRTKTDKMDAHLIARYTHQHRPACWAPPGDLLVELQSLTRARDELTTSIVQLKNQKHAAKRAFFSASLLDQQRQQQLELLKKHLEELEERIRLLLLTDAEVTEKLERLLTLPGVGFKIASVFLSETKLMSFDSGNQLAAFAGLNPQIQESGKSRGQASISKKGNKRLRRAAYQAALCCLKTKGFFSTFYQRLRDKGKPAKVALIALAHKILCTALALIRNRSTFKEDFEHDSKVGTVPAIL